MAKFISENDRRGAPLEYSSVRNLFDDDKHIIKLKSIVNSHCQALDMQLPDILELRREVKDFSNCTRNCLVAPIRLERGTLRTIAKALKDSGICTFDYVNDVAWEA